MKILVCHNSYQSVSGEDIVIATDTQFLKRRGIEVVEYKRANVETDNFTLFQRLTVFPNAVYSLRTAREVKVLVKKERPDVALVQNVFPLISPSVYYALHRVKVPIVQLVYNYRLICPNAILYTQGKICERCVKGNFVHAVRYKCFKESYVFSMLYASILAAHRHVRDVAELISAFVTPDLFLREKLIQGGFPRERIFPLLTPIDAGEYEPHYEHKGYFVYFGRIVREKGIFTALKAMKALPKSRLFVVGGGDEEEEARAMVSAMGLDNVQFTGPKYNEKLTSILRDALAVVVPTEWYDNSPLVVLQAMSLGKPVIASNIDGIPEIVHDEQEGLLFQPGNVDELVERMKKLQSDEELRLQLGHAARSKAEALLTSENRVRGLLKVIEYAQNNKVPR
jgi:glycosyltransferase involved in cell wall biosynthesis